MSVYPNPANNNIMVSGYKFESPALVRITDLKGSIVLEQLLNVANTQIDISTLAKGAYVLQVGSSNMQFVKQ